MSKYRSLDSIQPSSRHMELSLQPTTEVTDWSAVWAVIQKEKEVEIIMDNFELYDEDKQFDEGRSLLFPNADDEEFEEELMDLLDN